MMSFPEGQMNWPDVLQTFISVFSVTVSQPTAQMSAAVQESERQRERLPD